jgi:hypothetical protein
LCENRLCPKLCGTSKNLEQELKLQREKKSSLEDTVTFQHMRKAAGAKTAGLSICATMGI